MKEKLGKKIIARIIKEARHRDNVDDERRLWVTVDLDDVVRIIMEETNGGDEPDSRRATEFE